jgi:hypothetical protein
MAHECPHGGVKPQALCIVHIFIPSEPSKNRLPKKGDECVLGVLAKTAFGKF